MADIETTIKACTVHETFDTTMTKWSKYWSVTTRMKPAIQKYTFNVLALPFLYFSKCQFGRSYRTIIQSCRNGQNKSEREFLSST